MRRVATLGTSGICLVLLVATAGCVSRQRLTDKETELAELRKVNETQVEALAVANERLSNSRQRSDELGAERDALSSDLTTTRHELEENRNTLATVEQQKAGLATQLEQAQRVFKAERDRLKAATRAASEQVDELTRLRAQAAEFTRRQEVLQTANTALRAENRKTHQELERTNSELLAANAVIRSITAAGVEGQDAQAAVLQAQVAQLEREKRALEAEKDVLASRVVDPSATGDQVELAAASAPATVATAGAEGTWQDFFALVGARAKLMARGEASWDAVDKTLACAAVGGVLLLGVRVWLPHSWRRRTRSSRELAALHQRIEELEMQDASVGAQQPSPAPRRARPSTVVRRGGKFSPIIQSTDETLDEIDVSEEEIVQTEEEIDAEVTVQLGSFDPVDLTALDPQETESPSADVEEPSAYDDDTASVPESAAPAVEEDAWADDDDDDGDDDDEFANTQIIPSLSELEELGDVTQPMKPAQKKKKGSKRDREFMDELKDIIGQKVDEMIQ